jgi:hypothetical protein
MGTFCKQEDCPASEELLALRDIDEQLYAAELIDHLSLCEFCLAELEFYRLHLPVDEVVAAGQIPGPLFELAESLLKKKNDLTPLYNLIDHAD